MPLYGHELTESINPFQAGLGFAVNLEGREFVGRAALERLQNDPTQLGAWGWNWPAAACRASTTAFRGRRAGRRSHQRHVFAHAQKPIAMAYVQTGVSCDRHECSRRYPRLARAGRVVKLPFYKRRIVN